MKKLFAVFTLVGMLLSGCVYVDMNVENKPSPGVDFSKLKTFGFKKRSETRKDLEAVLLNSAKLELQSKGFVFDADNPDFLVMVGFGSKAFVERGVTYRRDAVEYDFISKSYSEIGVNQAPDATRQDNTVRVYLLTADKTYLWKGTASSVDFEGVGVVGKCLVKGALEKFPAADGQYRAKFNVNDCQ
ncbi:DUF4136 domain-containing protein [Maridesulfovibrio sp. FT414]|uniref:DUF4136 domain-containing protein n=1 Tax=Maridesulfovibrio sp. FT414 TaxID=2979469 RepID=UPI003D807B4C